MTVPTVVASGDAQFNRQQDQTNASLLSLGGGTRRGNNYLWTACRSPTCATARRPTRQSRRSKKSTCRCTPTTPRPGAPAAARSTSPTKSGTNNWRGSGFYQTRPRWGATNNFFSELAGEPKPETYFHLGGGGFGGPIIRNRTFFWAAFEGYGSNTTRNGALRFPTCRERRGDFSQTFDSAGRSWSSTTR